jgi:hypothetical protein
MSFAANTLARNVRADIFLNRVHVGGNKTDPGAA